MPEVYPSDNKKSASKSPLLTIVAAILIFTGGWVVGTNDIGLSLLNKNDIQSRNASLPEDLDFKSTDDVYDALRANFDGNLSVEQLTNGLKKGLANASGDPYTEYLTDKEASEFDGDLNGKFSGIGAELSKKDDQIVVVAPLSGYPADKAGLRPKDAIVEINGESTFDMSLTEAVNKIRGEAGTKVKLVVARDGKTKKYSITRENITIPSVEYKMLDKKIGYLKISRFAEDTADLATEAANSFKQKRAEAVIVDLRGNPGGLLESSVKVASLWLDDGSTVVVEKRGQEVIKTHRANGNNILSRLPTVALIDEGSASASEILAGALKDNNKATLIGVDSFGKGSVQQLTPISSGGVLKITIARWYTPNGRNIDKEGISPDKKTDRSAEDVASGRDPQLSAAKKYLEEQ